MTDQPKEFVNNCTDKFVKVSGTDNILYIVDRNQEDMLVSAQPVRKGSKIDPFDVSIGTYVIESWGHFVVPKFLLKEHTTEIHKFDSLLSYGFRDNVEHQLMMNYTVYPRTSDAVKFNKMYRQSAIYRIRSIYQAAIETANSKQPLWVGSQFRKVKGVDDLIIYVLPCTEAGTETAYFRCFIVRPGNTRKETYELALINNHVIMAWEHSIISELKLKIFTDPIATEEFEDVIVDDDELTMLWKMFVGYGSYNHLKGDYITIPYNSKYRAEQSANLKILQDFSTIRIPSSEWFN